MKCEVALEHVAEFAEDRVEAPLRVVLERHFAECDPCRGELASARELIQLFRDLPVIGPPPGFRAQVLARAAEQPSHRRAAWLDRWSLPIGRFRIPVVGLAAAGLTAGLLFTQTSFHNTPTLGVNVDLSHFGGVRPAVPLPGSPDLLIAGSSILSLRVGKPISLDVLVQPKADLTNGRVILPQMSDSGLVCENPSVPSERGRIVWQGPVPAGNLHRIPLHFQASRPGVYRVLLYIEGDRQNYQRLLIIPVAGPAEQKSPASEAKGFWSTSETLEEIAGRLGVIIATDLSHERQEPTDLNLAAADQAVAQVAARRGMQVTESGGVFNVYSPTR